MLMQKIEAFLVSKNVMTDTKIKKIKTDIIVKSIYSSKRSV